MIYNKHCQNGIILPKIPGFVCNQIVLKTLPVGLETCKTCEIMPIKWILRLWTQTVNELEFCKFLFHKKIEAIKHKEWSMRWSLALR